MAIKVASGGGALDTDHIAGMSELGQFLNELPVKLQKNILRAALASGARVMRDDAKSICPVGPPSNEGRRLYGHYEGALRDSIRVSTKSNPFKVSASVKAGGKSKKTGADVWYAHLIEYAGAKAHTIESKKFGSLFIGGLFKKAADHPGMNPQPFMRPAFDKNVNAATIAVGNYIKNRLATKHGLDTADISIGDDE